MMHVSYLYLFALALLASNVSGLAIPANSDIARRDPQGCYTDPTTGDNICPRMMPICSQIANEKLFAAVVVANKREQVDIVGCPKPFGGY
jgi:hypothetical protein